MLLTKEKLIKGSGNLAKYGLNNGMTSKMILSVLDEKKSQVVDVFNSKGIAYGKDNMGESVLIKKQPKCSDVVNSSSLVQGSGFAPLISQLAIATGMVFEQENYIGDYVDNKQLSISDYMPVVQAPNYAYSQQMFYIKQKNSFDITPESLSTGWTNLPGQVSQTDGEAADISRDYVEQDIMFYAQEISFNEIQAQASQKLGIDLIKQTMENYYKRYSMRMMYSVFSGLSDLDKTGFLNMDALKDVPSSDAFAIEIGMTKPICQMTYAEIGKLAQGMNNLKSLRYAGGYAGSMKKPTLVIPTPDYLNSNTQIIGALTGGAVGVIGTAYIGMSYIQYLERATGFTILPLKLATKSDQFNPQGANNVYTFYDNSADVFEYVEVQPISLYAGMQTANGVDYKGVMTAQTVFPFVINPNKIYRIKVSATI